MACLYSVQEKLSAIEAKYPSLQKLMTEQNAKYANISEQFQLVSDSLCFNVIIGVCEIGSYYPDN